MRLAALPGSLEKYLWGAAIDENLLFVEDRQECTPFTFRLHFFLGFKQKYIWLLKRRLQLFEVRDKPSYHLRYNLDVYIHKSVLVYLAARLPLHILFAEEGT